MSFKKGFSVGSLLGDFTGLFFLKEGRQLLGKRLGNFFFMTGIMALTFFAIGFANGSLDYLAEKMDDPFVKWITIEVPYSKTDIIDRIKGKLSEDVKAQQKFGFRSVEGYNIFYLQIFNMNKGKGSKVFTGRTIENGNPLLKKLLDDDNLVYGRDSINNNELALIVTERLLKEMGYSINTPFLLMGFSDTTENADNFAIPIPVIAVVQALPGMSDFISTPNFYYQRMHGSDYGNPFNPNLSRGIELLTTDNDEKKATQLHSRLTEYFSTHPEFGAYRISVFISEYTQSFHPCYQLSIVPMPDTSVSIRDRIYESLIMDKRISKFNFVRFYNYNQLWQMIDFRAIRNDRLTVEFLSLDHLAAFKSFLSSKYDIEMDMAQIEEKENYNFISKLTRIISLILIIFSVLSICLFISNLLSSHLEKIKMNIGTFKAFGVENHLLERIYLAIVICFVLASVTLSLPITLILGEAGLATFLLSVLNIQLEPARDYFNLYTEWTVITICLILVMGFLVLKITAHRIFKHTPGDLIYERENDKIINRKRTKN